MGYSGLRVGYSRVIKGYAVGTQWGTQGVTHGVLPVHDKSGGTQRDWKPLTEGFSRGTQSGYLYGESPKALQLFRGVRPCDTHNQGYSRVLSALS
jgi:hypothetical protein